MKISRPRGASAIPTDQAARVAAWETSLGRKLPPDYRTFLIRYDGGYPYPNTFDDVTPDAVRRSADRATICDLLFSLEEVKAETAGEILGEGVPPGFLLIGQDPGGLVVMLSLRPGDTGAIFVWQGSTYKWGTDGNDESRVFKQADSFTAFLDSLYDTPDKAGYDGWATPWRVANAVELDLR